MTVDKLLVLAGGIIVIGFIYVWFLTDWGQKQKKKEVPHEHHH